MDTAKPLWTDLDREFHSYYVLFILHDCKAPCVDEDWERFYSELRNPHCIHGRIRKGCYQCIPPTTWSTSFPR